ncbi:MAG: GNAT family N-acetyltransferase [Candidatus Thorarchaeota archaeon]|nr:GNAT family N-acetyltransferase [Candidatus Thorarchaeota archaeon]
MKEPIIEIEKAEKTDLDDILVFVNKVNKEWYSKIIPAEHWYEPFLTKQQIRKMSEIMDFFIHKQRDSIIAVGSFGTIDEESAWIPLMYMRSDSQGKGIGSSLMYHLEEIARQGGFRRIQLETDSKAEWALNFYRKHGYSIFKKDENPWGYHVWLEKLL